MTQDIQPGRRMQPQRLRGMLTPLAAVGVTLAMAFGASYVVASLSGVGETASTAIPYQGYLEHNGAAPSGTFDIRVRFFDGAATEIYAEQHNDVQVAAGRFSLQLGDGFATDTTNPIAFPALAQNALAIELSVRQTAPINEATWTDLLGRQQLGAVAFAHRGAPGKDFVVDGGMGIGRSAQAGVRLSVLGKTHITRDGIAECCGNDASVSIGEDTASTGRAASISFHNSGVHEGSFDLAPSGARRFRMYDNQGSMMGLELSGALSVGGAATTGGNLSVGGNLGTIGTAAIAGGILPNYDSGWVAGPAAGGSTNLTHNLGTQIFSHVQVIGSNTASGANPTYFAGATSSGTGQYGWTVQATSANVVAVGAYVNGGPYVQSTGSAWTGAATYMRIRLWR